MWSILSSWCLEICPPTLKSFRLWTRVIWLADIGIDLVFSELRARFDVVDHVFNVFKDEFRSDTDRDIPFTKQCL